MICPKRKKSGSTAYFAEVLFLYTIWRTMGDCGRHVFELPKNVLVYFQSENTYHCRSKKVFCNNHIIAIHLGGRWSHHRSELSHRANSPGRELEGNSTQTNICQALLGCPIYMSQLGWHTCYLCQYEPIRLAHFGRFETHVTYVCTTGSAADVDKMNSCLHPLHHSRKGTDPQNWEMWELNVFETTSCGSIKDSMHSLQIHSNQTTWRLKSILLHPQWADCPAVCFRFVKQLSWAIN